MKALDIRDTFYCAPDQVNIGFTSMQILVFTYIHMTELKTTFAPTVFPICFNLL